jgi:hypothetical protein
VYGSPTFPEYSLEPQLERGFENFFITAVAIKLIPVGG